MAGAWFTLPATQGSRSCLGSCRAAVCGFATVL